MSEEQQDEALSSSHPAAFSLNAILSNDTETVQPTATATIEQEGVVPQNDAETLPQEHVEPETAVAEAITEEAVMENTIVVNDAPSMQEAPVVAPIIEAPTPAPAPAARGGRGRGRGSKRGRGASSTTTSAAAGGSSRVHEGASGPGRGGRGRGRGSGKRKSEAASLAQDGNGNGEPASAIMAVTEPRKKRKAAQAARRIIETDDEDEEEHQHSGVGDASAMAIDTHATSQENATAPPAPAPAPALTPDAVPEDETTSIPKVTLKLKARNTRSTASPVDVGQQQALMPEATDKPLSEVPVIMNTTTPEAKADPAVSAVAPTSAVPSEEVQLPQMVHLDPSAVVIPNELPDLFPDDEIDTKQSTKNPVSSPAASAPVIGEGDGDVEGGQLATSTDQALPKKATPAGITRKKSVARPGTESIAKRAGSTASSTESTRPKAPHMKKAPLPKSGSVTSKLNHAGGVTPSSSGTPIPGVMKKTMSKPATAAITATSTPKQSTGTPASSLQAETSFLDSLFADTIPQTEHERALQKERDEKNRKAEIEKAKADKKLKEDTEATAAKKKNASTASSTPNAGSSGSGSKASGANQSLPQGRPPPITLKSAAGARQPGQSVLSRLGGSEKMRQQEIEKMRSDARQEQERLAKVRWWPTFRAYLRHYSDMQDFTSLFIIGRRLRLACARSGNGSF